MGHRIAISGSAGTGKSTLARRLATSLGLPYIGEGMREYLERTGTNLHDLGHEGVRAVVLELWEARKQAEEEAREGFVADRASYDFGAFWMYYRFAGPDALTEQLFAETLAPGRYDRVYVLPWGRIPLVADGIRSPDRWTQLHVQLLIEGMLRRHAPDFVEIISVDVEGRLAEVLADRGR